MKRLFLLLTAVASLISCDKGSEQPKALELTGGTSTSQIIYADETSKADGIKFIAKEPWTATIAAVKASDVDWLTLSRYSGSAGEFTLSLTLKENTSGSNRKAEIHINCGTSTITITVEQKTTNKPDEPENPSSEKVFITANGKITGGEIFGKSIPAYIKYLFTQFMGGGEYPEVKTAYQNKTFNITLPVPSAKAQGVFIPGLNVVPSDAKFSTLVLETDNNGVLELNNFDQSISEENRRLKKGEGRVMFVYASKAATVSGTSISSLEFRTDTFVFDNCAFRQGWNEMMMVATQDETADRRVTFSVTMNNSNSSFRWYCDASGEGEDEKPCVLVVDKIEITDNNTLNPEFYGGKTEFKGSYNLTFSYDNKFRVAEIKNNNAPYYAFSYGPTTVDFMSRIPMVNSIIGANTDQIDQDRFVVSYGNDADFSTFQYNGNYDIENITRTINTESVLRRFVDRIDLHDYVSRTVYNDMNKDKILDNRDLSSESLVNLSYDFGNEKAPVIDFQKYLIDLMPFLYVDFTQVATEIPVSSNGLFSMPFVANLFGHKIPVLPSEIKRQEISHDFNMKEQAFTTDISSHSNAAVSYKYTLGNSDVEHLPVKIEITGSDTLSDPLLATSGTVKCTINRTIKITYRNVNE